MTHTDRLITKIGSKDIKVCYLRPLGDLIGSLISIHGWMKGENALCPFEHQANFTLAMEEAINCPPNCPRLLSYEQVMVNWQITTDIQSNST